VSRKEKLLARLISLPSDFTWDEAVRLLKQCNFEQLNNSGSRRKFRHKDGVKLSIHEPHPEPTLKNYALKDMIDALQNSGEL